MRNKPIDVRKQAIRELLTGCPSVFGMVLKHIDELKFYDRPDYRWLMEVCSVFFTAHFFFKSFLFQTLRSHLTSSNIPEHPYDWEPGAGDAAVDCYFR